MCDLEVDLDDTCRAQGREPAALAAGVAALAPMASDGLVVVEGLRIRVPPAARPLLRTIAAAFDRYLADGAGQHSQAG